MTCAAPEPAPILRQGQAWRDPAGGLWFVIHSDSRDRLVLLSNKYGEEPREITDELKVTILMEWTFIHE